MSAGPKLCRFGSVRPSTLREEVGKREGGATGCKSGLIC